jgi:hypothetical protein
MESSSIRLSNEGMFLFFFKKFQTHGNNKVKNIIEQPMSKGLVKNTSKNNWRKTIHYNLKNVPS